MLLDDAGPRLAEVFPGIESFHSSSYLSELKLSITITKHFREAVSTSNLELSRISSGTHVALLHSVPHRRSSSNLPGRMGEQFAAGERPASVLKTEFFEQGINGDQNRLVLKSRASRIMGVNAKREG